MNPTLLALLGTQLIAGSGQQQMNQALAGHQGQPTNWGAIGGGLSGTLLGAGAGALAGRGLSKWARGRIAPVNEQALAELKWTQGEGSDAYKAALQQSKRYAKISPAAAQEGEAVALKGIRGMIGKGAGSLGKMESMLAAKPGMTTALGALAGASILGGMLAKKSGAQADQQYAAKMQNLQALDAQQQQENLAALSKLPQIRF